MKRSQTKDGHPLAIAFKYQAGSFFEYALKKEKLLLEVRRSIDIGTLIDIIAFGSPNYVSDKIGRGTLQRMDDLYNKIRKLEHLFEKNKYDKKSTIYSDTKPRKIQEKQPC